MNNLNNKNFNKDQIHQIREGILNGFSEEQIKLYIKPEFDIYIYIKCIKLD